VDAFAEQFRLLVETREAGVTELVTFNTDDFQNMPGLVVRHPSTVAARTYPCMRAIECLSSLDEGVPGCFGG
jgi:hypothetical protein